MHTHEHRLLGASCSVMLQFSFQVTINFVLAPQGTALAGAGVHISNRFCFRHQTEVGSQKS